MLSPPRPVPMTEPLSANSVNPMGNSSTLVVNVVNEGLATEGAERGRPVESELGAAAVDDWAPATRNRH